MTVQIPELNLEDGKLKSEWAGNFHQRFEELYSYRQSEQEIRLVTLRVSVSASLPSIDESPDGDTGTNGPADMGVRKVYTGGWKDTPIYAAGNISAGEPVRGPAILQSNFTTVVLGRGDTAVKGRVGTWLMG